MHTPCRLLTPNRRASAAATAGVYWLRKDRVRYRGANGHHAELTDAARLLGDWPDVRLDSRHLRRIGPAGNRLR